MHEAAAPGPLSGPAALARGGPWCNRPAGASTRSPPASVAPEDPWARAATCGPAGSHPAPPCLVPNQAPVLAGACPVRGAPWAARGPWCTVVLCGARSRCVVHGHGHGCTVVVCGARRVVFVPGPRPAGRALPVPTPSARWPGGRSPFLSPCLGRGASLPITAPRWDQQTNWRVSARRAGPGGSLVQMNIDWLEAPGRRALHPGHVCNKAGPPGRA